MFVSHEKEISLRERWARLGLREEDVEERFIRAGGAGGQHVNKTETCVYLKHLPSGLEVKCQQERSQTMNRFFARRLLADKYESLIRGRESAERQAIEKIRRQKRKRSKRAKDKMLEAKHRQSDKKRMRSSSSLPFD